MNIHEYQARELLQKFDVATTRGESASTADEVEQIASELGDIDLATGRVRPTGGLAERLDHVAVQQNAFIAAEF